MDKNTIKVIKFLVSGKAYSDSAIMKNIGIDCEELQRIYKVLEEEGYLQSYEEFLKYNQLEDKEEKSSCSSGGCGGCSKGCSPTKTDKKCCNSNDDDYSNIKVLTMKAITKFGE